MDRTYRVAVIGSTGKGDYGHGLDSAFVGVKRATVIAVADDDEAGRKKAGERLKVDRLYADYRDMLAKEKPDVVCIGPRWLTARSAMVKAAAEAGCHIYCEKPFVAELGAADALQAVCDKAGVRLALAHQWRAMPPVRQALADLRAGKYGQLLRMRARPKDDARGGGEELLVHGTHWFDLMIAIAGPPHWVSGHIAVAGRDARREDKHEGSEPVGPIAGDSVVAMVGFDGGVRGFFDSTANMAPKKGAAWDSVYGLTIECEKATLQLRQPGDVFIYPAAGVLPDFDALKWEKVWVENWHFTPEHKPRPLRQEWLRLGNQSLANDLLDAIEGKRDPISPLRHGVQIAEMVQGVYASHFADGRRLPLPLTERRHPLLGG
jgi:predicted dehydrogenase